MRDRERWVRCSQCGNEIQTVQKKSPSSHAQVICRKCFGQTTYGGKSPWVNLAATWESMPNQRSE